MFAKIFGSKKDEAPPTGEIATTIIDLATNSAAPEVDWPSVFSTVELIKAYYPTPNPKEGCLQALKAIRFRLESEDPVVINYTLTLLDTCFKNCDRTFQIEVGQKEFTKYLQRFLERPTLAPENRGQCLELIADWSTQTDVSEIKRLFETLVKAGYRFTPESLSKVSPQVLESLRRTHGTPAVVYTSSNGFGGGVQQQQPNFAPQGRQQRVDEVSPEERVKWVQHDIGLCENSVAILVETLNFAEPGEDVSRNEIAVESFNRCVDLQRRIIDLIEKVQEPELVDKLITCNSSIVAALDQFNAMKSKTVTPVTTTIPSVPLLSTTAPMIDFDAPAVQAPPTTAARGYAAGGAAAPLQLPVEIQGGPVQLSMEPVGYTIGGFDSSSSSSSGPGNPFEVTGSGSGSHAAGGSGSGSRAAEAPGNPFKD
ncbi:hypothetical protein HDU98_011898 [Podochytrium sp. JEL0797]|nr:hypothetical protein HDU98_011898 [Podochytrium sp. JEL0797]